MTRPTIRTVVLIATLLVGFAAAPVSAQQLAPEQRVEFNKLVQQRNRLVVQLRKLDERASTLLKQGQDATVVHAEQISIQDQLDLAELRLAIFATRHGLAVPAPPGSEPDGFAGGGDGDGGDRYGRTFDRGRDRANRSLRRDALRFLSSLNFEKFLRGR